MVIDAVAADDPQALQASLEALGAEVTAVAGRLVSARLPLDQLPALDGVEALKFARPALARHPHRLGDQSGGRGARLGPGPS